MAALEGVKLNAVVERFTVWLIAKAADDLRRTRARSGLSRTDVVNRAISLYEFVDRRQAAGDEILVRRRETGGLQLVRLY